MLGAGPTSVVDAFMPVSASSSGTAGVCPGDSAAARSRIQRVASPVVNQLATACQTGSVNK